MTVNPRTSTLVMTNVEDRVRSIIATNLCVELDRVVLEADFAQDLGADSLEAVELIMALETTFNLDISDEEAEAMTTLAECLAMLKTKI
jgi:acyl carrier protein